MSGPLGTRAAHWKSLAAHPLPNTTTFAAQDTLPRLPVPKLEDTLARLKTSLRPISLSSEEYNRSVTLVDEFGRNAGPKLHARLLERAKEKEHWLEEWWDEGAYLAYRDSVVVNVSYYYGFDAHPSHLKQTSTARAAGLARTAMLFRKSLKRGLLKPEMTKEGPLCMDTYRWMFDCCRIPVEGADRSVSYSKPGDKGDSGHIVVFRHNRPWKVELFTDTGHLLSANDIERQMEYIVENSTSEYPGVGVLTASDRDTWAKDYIELSKSQRNTEIIQAIHSAAFTISLDSYSPTNSIEHSRSLWHGHSGEERALGLENRWVDKPVQFVVFDNVYAGLMGEHSIMDGTPTARLCDDILEMLGDQSFDHGSPSNSVPQPQPLDWEVTPKISDAIETATKRAHALIDSQSLTFHLTSYGKAAIKSYGVSPDSWAQMIVQLAYKRLVGEGERKGATYEAATTRRFYKGRTEAIRVVTDESDAWVNSMDDDSVDTKEKKRLFDIATARHVQLAKTSGTGNGIDRHMFGLKKLLQSGEDVPSLFSDPLYLRSSYWVLSTSAIFSKHFPVYGWGEVVPDGFGVAYMTGYDDRLQFTITARKEMPNAKFCEEIAKAAVDLEHLHDTVKKCKL